MGNLCDQSKQNGSSLIQFEKVTLTPPKQEEVSTVVESPSPRKRQDKKDFVILGLVGKGAFGVVYKVMKKDSGKIYAMKEISKQVITEHKLESNNFLERNILKQNQCPFIVKLRYAFQSHSKCYFVMDFVAGGELFKILKDVGPLPEKIVKFLIAEIILALEYLHKELGIIYRDLKPENILLTEKGHVKLTDFGLATSIKDQSTYTMAGTPEYLAPEVITRAGHSYEVDFWTLGILIYEMLAGYAPFTDADRNVKLIQDKIMMNRPVYSTKISSNARNLISGLLKFNPKQRLGASNFDQLKSHIFFKGINFDNIHEQTSPLENYATDYSDQLNANLQPLKDNNQSPFTGYKELENFSYDPELENPNILK